MASIADEVREALRAVATGALAARCTGFAGRSAALDFLEVHVLDRLQYLDEGGCLPSELQDARAEARTLQQRLEQMDDRVVRRLGDRIRDGRFTREGLRRALGAHAGRVADKGGYDAVDRLMALLLAAGAPSAERTVLGPDMVGYQPTPARAILSLVEKTELGPDDVFYDLGSGLGQVVLLVALLTEARARGVEIEPAYCEYARRCARGLGLGRVEIVEADVRAASLSEGTVYFMYTPFRGALMDEVSEALRAEARKRTIRVCTYGPCTASMARAGWLTATDGHEARKEREEDVAVFWASRARDR